ncbi:MAG: chemotaxis protein [Verrucomicrobia bacterium]|nr:chemotaxis protein [Verrucomicrobiota bacterium]
MRMNTSTLSFKLTTFLIAAVAIALAIGGGMHSVLRKVEAENASRTTHVIAAKNATYQLLETIVDAQAALQNTLRIKDPDEIETSIGHFKNTLNDAQQLIKNTADIPPVIGEKLDALTKTDQEVIDKFLIGENSAAFELMMTTVPQRFEALTQAIRAYSTQVETALKNDAEASGVALQRLLRWAAVACGVLSILLLAYGWRFRNSTVNQLQRLSDQLDEASKQVAQAADQVSTASQQLASGANEQASSLEETSASLNEMSSMTKRNAEGAVRANELARGARKSADTGASDMKQMHDSMGAIKASSDDIAKIIKTIDEIAFQTNILALNAAVEAARAGTAGAGFAVVADEVRALAQRSATASRETSGKIEAAIAKTDQGVQISSRVTENLGEIVETVRKVDDLIAEVATASGEQNLGVDQINTAVSQIEKITQNNAASAEESAAAAEQLKAQAMALQDAVTELSKMVGHKKGFSAEPIAKDQSVPPSPTPEHKKTSRRPSDSTKTKFFAAK